MKKKDFDNILNIFRIIRPHSKKFNMELFNKYLSNFSDFKKLIKQLEDVLKN